MDEKIAYWVSVAAGALALALLVLNIAFVNTNRSLQDEVNQRQAAINKGATYSQVNQGLVQALANAALKNGDTDARDLLTTQGYKLKGGGAEADTGSKIAKSAGKKKEEEMP